MASQWLLADEQRLTAAAVGQAGLNWKGRGASKYKGQCIE
jgi:hypothetical protein